MKSEMDNFEQRLRRQPVKQIPPGWRGEILAAARREQSVRHSPSVLRRSWLSIFNDQLSALLWPHPKAWAGLAAAWVFIFALNLAIRENPPRVVEKVSPPSPEIIVELKRQQRMLAELVGQHEEPVADRPKTSPSRPRTEILETTAA